MPFFNRKTKARKLALQALYQWQIEQIEIAIIIDQFNQKERDFSKSYFLKLVSGSVKNIDLIDKNLQLFLDRKINQLNLIEKALLRLAAFELIYCPEIPTKVIIDQAIELAKNFASEDSYKYANAVLHKLSQSIDRSQSVFSKL